MTPRNGLLRLVSALGALVGYGFLAVFLYLVGWQVYHWFRDGEWTHVGLSEGLRGALLRCCVNESGGGRVDALLQWLDSPASWLGMHKVVEVIPASLALFAVSIAGNCVFIYCKDRLEQR
jgi:hypothetical protein